MFAVIYRGFIYPQQEKHYQEAWHCIAKYFIEHCGALGSALHKTTEGEYIAYSRWPDKAKRDAVWGENANPVPENIQQAIKVLKMCIDLGKSYDEIEMHVIHVIDDFLLTTAV
ncbi:MAG: hypothetical protein K0R12_987 [Gammaproteobacteria bacterium]|jgi:hypothetical protein|nr:hypothetical protein [Gammaproteobacteria bacterium]